MSKICCTAWLVCMCSGAAFAQPGDIPGAQPGKCYAKCLVYDKYETLTEQVMSKPASEETTVILAKLTTGAGYYAARESYIRLVAEPALFETLEENVQVAPPGYALHPAAYDSVREAILIKPATKYYVVEDAQFETVQSPVEIEPAYMQLEVLPQQYETVLQNVPVRPASTRWVRKKSDRDCLGADPDDCYVWCLVEEPAQYQPIYIQVPRGCDGNGSADCVRYLPVAAKTTPMPVQKVKTPAKARELMAPAEYQTVVKWVLRPGAVAPAADGPGTFVSVSKKILKRPAQVREEIVPAEYKTIVRKILEAPATLKVRQMPPEFVTITKRELVRKGGFSEWREIICGEKMTGYTIRQIQEALKALGYYRGAVDGKLSAGTKSAIMQFQTERQLPADGNVDFETLKALGIVF